MLRNFSKYLRFKSKCVLILMPLFTPDTTIKRKCSIGEVFISVFFTELNAQFNFCDRIF